MTGNTGGAEQMAQMFTGQREDTDYSAVLQGRPVLTSNLVLEIYHMDLTTIRELILVSIEDLLLLLWKMVQ